MDKIGFICLLMLTVLNFISCDNVTVPSLQKLSQAQLEFSLDIYQTLCEELSANASESSANLNLLISPYSVMSVLSMLYLGSSGSTSEQLTQALHFHNMSYVEVHRSYKKVLDGVKMSKIHQNLTIANKIFVQKNVNVSQVYSEKLLEYYDAEVELVDFSNTSFAKELINTWVRVHTRGQIESLLKAPPSSVTSILLANVVYFKGSWLYKFDKKRTYERATFRMTAHGSTSVAMMVARLKVPHGHSEELKCSILELPYSDARLSMFIFLPDEIEGLVQLEQQLTTNLLNKLLANLKKEAVNVRLPRFNLESKLTLRETLVKMGLNDIFVQGQADLSGLTTDITDAYVNEVSHRTSIRVNEDGSEASAATALDVERIGAFGESYFEADHPFLFFIWDYQIRTVLFIGKLVDPSSQ
ncbi:Serpin peptidase inhibitor, clade B (Ovalbumin), member [Chamberlinius hualienensis]